MSSRSYPLNTVVYMKPTGLAGFNE
jgi:hypothetical protein